MITHCLLASRILSMSVLSFMTCMSPTQYHKTLTAQYFNLFRLSNVQIQSHIVTPTSLPVPMIATRGHSSRLLCHLIMDYISHNPLPRLMLDIVQLCLITLLTSPVYSLILCEVCIVTLHFWALFHIPSNHSK